MFLFMSSHPTQRLKLVLIGNTAFQSGSIQCMPHVFAAYLAVMFAQAAQLHNKASVRTASFGELKRLV